MGVSGSGKTTIGTLLAEKLAIPFFDGDDFHSESNISKMRQGTPLTDDDRASWLDSLRIEIAKWSTQEGAILACSALKEKYRRQLQSGTPIKIQWIILHADESILGERLAKRKGHYFGPELLNSQLTAFEMPKYGWKISAEMTPQAIINQIMARINAPNKNRIGILGLGTMGQNLALNFADHNIAISVYNREVAGIEEGVVLKFLKNYPSLDHISGFADLHAFVQSLEKPRKILLMISAGRAVDDIIEQLIPLLENGDILIDGGNSHYLDTERRIQNLADKQIEFIGAGISGGAKGARNGPSIMPGGSKNAYQQVSNFLELIAARDKERKHCCSYIGPGGSGHFIKMVHNGIEYGEMAILAETYDILKNVFNQSNIEIAQIFSQWGEENSGGYLLEITSAILRKKEGSDFLLDLISDQARQKGTGRWSVQTALDLGAPANTLAAAVGTRNISAQKQLRTYLSGIFKRQGAESEKPSLQELHEAFRAARLINHTIGFEIIRCASHENEWDLNLAEIARIWTAGCIIRSTMMEELSAILANAPDEHMFKLSRIQQLLKDNIAGLQNIVTKAIQKSTPVPVYCAALNYFLAITQDSSPAHLLQAQRDYFGQHGFQRIDADPTQFFHADWTGEKT